jgi:hypothetical protein
MEGVTPQAAALLDKDVVGLAVHIGICPMTSLGNALSDIIPLTIGKADYWALTQEPSRGAEVPNRRLSLSVGFGDTGRTRPRRVTYTDAQQRRLFPTDGFCRLIAKYNAGYVNTWPRFK